MEYRSTAHDVADVTLTDMERTVFAYWQGLQATGFAPRWADFHLEDLPPDAIPWCSVVDVIDETDAPLDFVVRFWGTARRDLYGYEITGMRVSLGDNTVSSAMFEQIVTVTRQRKPMYFRNVGRKPPGPPVEYGLLRLPLSDDGERVGKVFSISYFPELKAELHRLHGTMPPYGKSVIPRVS